MNIAVIPCHHRENGGQAVVIAKKQGKNLHMTIAMTMV